MGRSPLLEQVRREMRLRGYSIGTEKTYLQWIKRYIHYHKLTHPAQMGAVEVRAFLSYLANEQYVAINTQKTALNALAFLYHKVLSIGLGAWISKERNDLAVCRQCSPQPSGVRSLHGTEAAQSSVVAPL